MIPIREQDWTQVPAEVERAAHHAARALYGHCWVRAPFERPCVIVSGYPGYDDAHALLGMPRPASLVEVALALGEVGFVLVRTEDEWPIFEWRSPERSDDDAVRSTLIPPPPIPPPRGLWGRIRRWWWARRKHWG